MSPPAPSRPPRRRPAAWLNVCVCRRTVHDKKTGSDIVLSNEQLELVQRLQKGQFGDVNFNEYEVRPVPRSPRERTAAW